MICKDWDTSEFKVFDELEALATNEVTYTKRPKDDFTIVSQPWNKTGQSWDDAQSPARKYKVLQINFAKRIFIASKEIINSSSTGDGYLKLMGGMGACFEQSSDQIVWNGGIDDNPQKAV